MSESPARRPGVINVLMGTLPGRAIVIGAAVRLVDFLASVALGRMPAFLGVVDTVAAVAIAAAGLYFIARGLSLMRRRLLWRVRRKLIISYFFIGVIPAILLLAFSALGGVLLFYNFSAYMVRGELRSLSASADGIARTAAAEIERGGGRDVSGILARRQAAAAPDYPNMSMAVVRLDRPCADARTHRRHGRSRAGLDRRRRPLAPRRSAAADSRLDRLRRASAACWPRRRTIRRSASGRRRAAWAPTRSRSSARRRTRASSCARWRFPRPRSPATA